MMDSTKGALEFLKSEIESREKKTILTFEEYLGFLITQPEKALRNIFQLFHDMVGSYIGEGVDEYPDDPESIGYVDYDCSRLLVEGADSPFFADRLFANRFVRQIGTLKQGSQQNRIYVYEGPPGCGKSTFLDNLLGRFEAYTDTSEGQSFEVFWEIDGEYLPSKTDDRANADHPQKIEVACPSHDYPILLIPKNYRTAFLDRLLGKSMTELKHKLSTEKEYEWVFRDEVCTVCRSLFWALFDKLGSLDKVLSMVRVRPYKFDRRLGEGVSIFNPGDKPMPDTSLTDKQVQDRLDQIFGPNAVKYIFSPQARTNNGIYVLMDIKSHNMDRLIELHNVISEGVHRVRGDIEERINSLFFALMNPEDSDALKDKKLESLQARIQRNSILYVLEVPTEVKIYRSTFGNHIDARFLPGVLDNFARIIIASRMSAECPPIKEWVGDLAKYAKYCDAMGLLLRMEIYNGVIPSWLTDDDRKKFTADARKRVIAFAEKEGNKGFSGRDAIQFFGDFFTRYELKPHESKPNDPPPKLINMDNLTDYFKYGIPKEKRDDLVNGIPKGFIESLVNLYDYQVLGQVKEALYFYNEQQICKDILHYLCAINYDVGTKVICPATGEEIKVTLEFLKQISSLIAGKQLSDVEALASAQRSQKKYVETIAQSGKPITETDLYRIFFEAYTRNLKEQVLQPFIKNNTFRDAVNAYGTRVFRTFDRRMREHIEHMIKSLMDKFGYTEQGAKEICLYVIDQKLVEKFS